jgi:hypothetical protein
MTRQKCKKCGKGYKTLTEKGLCFFCHKNEYREIAKEFQPRGKGALNPMTFKHRDGKLPRAKGQPGRSGR